ncbi:putative reverse transcriptase domain-containing protein [Tanacetum coccineum]
MHQRFSTGLDEPVGVGAAEEGEVVCQVFQEWAKEQEKAFQTLKGNLRNVPILSLPDGSKEFVVYCDASNQGLGCVLMQRGRREALTADVVWLDNIMKEERWRFGEERVISCFCVLSLRSVFVKIRYFDWIIGYYRRFIANSSKVAKPLASLAQKIQKLCTHAKRQGRERDSRNVAWPGPTNGKEGRWRVVREDFKIGNLARLYTNEIVTRHGVHVSIISDRGGRFTSRL